MAAIDYSKLQDYNYYVRFLKIKTERRQIIPLHFNPIQKRLHQVWEWQLKTFGMVRLFILKARREGVSTYVESRLFHQTATVPNTGSFIITHDKASLAKVFNMSKLFWEELPREIRPMKRYSNKTELILENPKEKSRFTNPGLRSSIEVFSANTVTASRSGGYSIAHNSEVAFWENAEELITSIVPSIQDLPGTVIVNESTGNGRAGYFYEQWQKAVASLKSKRKLSKFYPVFFSWLEFPEYSTSFFSDEERKNFLETMDEEEIYLKERFGATLEQLNWRRFKILDFNGDVEKFHQEYPSNDEEAFVSKGTPYFSRKKLLEVKSKCIEPVEIGDIGEGGFVANEDGPLFIWERPIPGYEYVIGADVGEGIKDGDYSTIQVLKVPKNTPVVEQVAEWRGLIDPVNFAGKIADLGMWYNEALVAPELNNHGFTTLNELKQIYWNIYRWQYFDRFKIYQTDKLGWQTTVATKPLLCSYTASCLVANILIIRSKNLIDEMLSFVRNTTNSGEADYSCHDDLVMAYMIALFVLAHTHQSGSLLQQMGRRMEEKITPPSWIDEVNRVVEKMKRFDPSKMDVDLFKGNLMLDEKLVDVSDRSWLNY